jgi:hypothetical protein
VLMLSTISGSMTSTITSCPLRASTLAIAECKQLLFTIFMFMFVRMRVKYTRPKSACSEDSSSDFGSRLELQLRMLVMGVADTLQTFIYEI